jgi:TM2 domain-containing membrane protein YozV
MSNEEYGVEVKTLDIGLVFMLIFLGWLGLDKFYAAKGFKAGWKFALVKFAYTLIGIGILWNIFDIIQAFRKKYELDFRDYFR